LLVVDTVYQLRDVNGSKRLPKESEAQGVQKGKGLTVTVYTGY
jgi:hypothetical protein